MKGVALKGWRVVVTASEGERFCDRLERSGAIPIHAPTIAIRSLDGEPFDRALRRLDTYDWVVMTSRNGVASLATRLTALGLTIPAKPVWAAVGPRTGEVLESLGVEVRGMPSEQRAAAIPDAMGDVEGRRVLLVRAKRATQDLPMILCQRGAVVDDVVAYETIEGSEGARPRLEAALAEPLQAIVFTSGSTVRGFVRLLPDPRRALGEAVIACIGPVTAAAVREAGLGDPVVAAEPTPAAVVEVLVGSSDRDRERARV
jgi:uroporphyrinogen-III synthase